MLFILPTYTTGSGVKDVRTSDSVSFHPNPPQRNLLTKISVTWPSGLGCSKSYQLFQVLIFNLVKISITLKILQPSVTHLF